MYNSHVKHGLKIPNRLGRKISENLGGGDFFDMHCIKLPKGI